MNYFDLFGLPVSIRVDPAELNKKYVALQKKYHPDFFTQEDEVSQQEALEKSSEINKALKVLKNPDATIHYLLQLKGLATEGEKYQLPPDFLAEVMELNENLTDQSAREIETFSKSIYREVEPLVNNYHDEQVTRNELLRLKDYYFKKKYLQRILERMEG